MKRFLGIMVMALLLVLPLGVNAENALKSPVSCTDGSDNTVTCTVEGHFNAGTTQATVTLTEQGGATVNADSITGSEWTVSSK